MSRLVRLLLAVTLLFSTLPVSLLAPARTAYALDSGGVTEVITALQSLGTVVNSLSGLAGLGEPIPFTDVDPSEALNLDSLFTDALSGLGAPSSLADLATAIDGKDDPDLGGTGIAVQFNNVVGNDTNDTLSFDFSATRTVNVPLKFTSGDVNLDGSEIALTFTLTAPFALGYDGGASNPSEKVFLTNEPVVAVTTSANVPAITAFESLLGFTSVNVGGSVVLNAAIQATFADPDANGRLTVDEWSSTALGDLVTVAFVDAPGNDVDASLTLDAAIVPGAPDATVFWQDASLADGPGTPTVTLNALDDFTNVNASNIFSGLASATTALLAAQQSGDLQLPFLKDSLGDLFQFADPLVDFVHELGDAAIVCGPNDTVPPSGPIFGLKSGDTVFCRAYTINPVDLVDWKIDGVSSNTSLTTVGPSPSTSAQLVLGAGGLDSVTLDFHFQGESTARLARPLFLTADELTEKLLSVAGIDTVTPNYDPDKKILTYRLQEALPAVSNAVEADFGDQLRAQTGLFGLSQSGSDEITVEASAIAMDVTFGVILVEDPADIKAGGTNADRFFLQVGTGNEFQADVAIAAGSNFGLEGRLAFLEVTTTGTPTGPNPGGAIFSIGDSDDAPGAPSFSLNITAPGITSVALPQAIPDAILVSDLISGGIGPKIDAKCEIGFSSGLEVKATVGGATELASGNVGVSWPDVFTDDTCEPDLAGIAVTTDGDFDTDLLSFNINPDNPLEMLSIILDSIYGLAQAVDSLPAIGDLDVQIPVVGVSPRDLLDKLEEINVAINDARSDPAGTLQALETQLETELGIDPAALSFELSDVGPGAEKDLILRLGYSKADALVQPLNFDIDDGGLGLVSASTGGNISFGYTAGAQFDIAIPLKPGSALADTLVLETTRATAGGSLDEPALSFTAAVGPLEVGVTGQAKANVELVVENPDTNPLSLTSWLTGVGADLTGATQSCGIIDPDGTPDNGDEITLDGQACARLDLDVAGPIGTLGFRAADITEPDELGDPEQWYAYVPSGLTGAISSNVLNWAFLFKVLPELTTKLEGILASGSEDISVPGLGEALDAGADVVGEINTYVISPLSDIGSVVTGATAKVVEDQIEAEILSLGAIVLDRNNSGGAADADDVDVIARCGGADCADGDPVLNIDDVQVTFKIGQQISETPAFDIGIDGLPIAISGATTATGEWSLLLNLGLSKAEGPYIVADNGTDPELNLGASVTLADNPAPGACAADPSNPAFFPSGQFAGFSDTRCLEGTLAFLSVGMYDGNDSGDTVDTNDPTEIGLTTTLDLTSSAASGRLTAGNIINSVGLEPRFVADANIDLALRTSIDAVDGLPGVVGAFHLAWGFDTNNPSLGAPTVAFDRLNLDAGTFISDLLGPVVTEVRKVTSPLEPIVDFIQAEVPVLTQLAEMVGEDPVTVLTLIQASSGFSDEDIALIESVLQMISLANNLPIDPGAGNLFIPLGSGGNPGSFTLFGDKLLQGGTTPDQAGTLISSADAGTNLADELPGNAGVASVAATSRPGTFGVEGLTFPFLDDATQVFGLLLGQDVTIVRMDFGTFKASVSEGYEFGPIFIGPFPVTAEVGLAFTAEARFAMGYDTRGLRQVISGGSAIKLFNGIFIDDLDADGLDVDEWKLTFRVYAEAALDVLIVEAGVYGGVDATLSGNLDDRPNPDGKLYIEEIVDKLSNPICLFIISGKLDLFLGFFLEVDLFLWSDRWELEIIRVTLLDFTMGCEGENPNLADVVGGDLWLNIGTRANLRGIQESVIDEEFTVRQIGDGKVSVEAFGLKQERSGITGIVRADAADGDDIIAFVKGGNDANPIAFTIGSDLKGGAGNDSFTGGDGVDTFSGGAGADKLIGGKGNDILNGDGEDDRMDGGIGDDTLNGGTGNDTATGGPGADTIDGGDGDDSLLGGPWTMANPDGVDTITGGPGNDNLDGGPADDILNGDEAGLSCLDEGAATGGIDAILGGPGNDTIVGGYGDDRLIGNGGHVDDLLPYSDNDKLCGNAGNDILDGDDEDPLHDAADRDASGSGGFAGGLFGGSGNDVMYGRGGADEMFGGADDDDMWGGADGDTMNGDAGADEMYGDAGADTMNGNAGDDTMYGGADGDIMNGNEDADAMYGDAGADIMNGNAGQDIMRGGADNDVMNGNTENDEMYGDSGDDTMFGNEHDDLMRGGIGDDYLEGNAGTDTMYGDAGQDDMIGGTSAAGQPDAGDFMFGNAAQDVMAGDNASITRPGGTEIDGTIVRSVTLYDLAAGNSDTAAAGQDDMQGDEGNDDLYGGGEDDTLNGNAGDDMLEGNGGTDTLYGDAGQDDLIGGTSQGSGGQPDAADTIYGGSNGPDLPGDFDVIAGDNASIVRDQNGGQYVTDDFAGDTQDVVRRIVTLFDVATTDFTPAPNTSSGDTLFGEGGFDIMYGQGGDEIGMSGGSGNDEMYGNAGDDIMAGNDGQDDLVGGTGRTKSDDPASAVDGRLDGADAITGGSGTAAADADDYDVVLGDNATAFRTRDTGTGFWVTNTFNAAIARTIRFYDVGTVASAPGVGTSGGDLLRGEDNDDLLYGQGGDDDMAGDGGDDYMEGNAGTDTMSGNDGNDDMAGGTGRINDDPATGTDGRLDAGDFMYGNDGFDVMAGDNALLVRTLAGGQWVKNTFNDGWQHEPRILLDENSTQAALVSGGDLMEGGAQDDLMYGQAGDDDMDGNAGDDFMEGNSHDDLMKGSENQDDMIGGTVDGTIWDGADTMYGGSEGDVMAGDNATIDRPLASGLWQTDPNTGDEVRTVTLLNVQVVGGPVASPLLSGSDTMYGNDGSDRMFGQGNDDFDADGDGLYNEDPIDGVDNDMDGREGAGSTQYDCADGVDNDGDGQIDAADTQCAAKVDEDGGGDVMYGNAGHDFMEGNHGADFMYGNEDEDDMWGGSSSDATGVVGSGTPPDNLADANDILRGGEEDDVLIGDNGTIERPTDGGGLWLRHQGPRANGDLSPFDMVVRNVGVTRSPEEAGAFGNDWMQGNDGEDEGYGQQGHDYMEGNNGEDALLGDLGLITSSVQDGSNEQNIAPPGPFFTETIYPAGSFHREFELFSFTGVPGAAGNDILLGGDDRDSLHGADGDDIVNGDGDSTELDPSTGVDPNLQTADVDKVFGGDGADVLWGGRGDDNLWGGYGDDHLDVRPRPASATTVADPPLWFTFGRFDFYQGLDLIYGGWDRDAMQANVAAPGPRLTDRLIDWAGGYNVFYVCPGAYGEGTITRQGNPQFQRWMERVIDADGALQSATTGTSGYREFAYVFPNQRGQNSHPPHPDHPGHFTCDDGSIYVPSAAQTLSISALDLTGRRSAVRATVSAQATVKNGDGLAMAGVSIGLLWTLPGNRTEEQFATTDKNGVAKFSVSGLRGDYSATVSDLALQGYAVAAESLPTAAITVR